MACAQSKFVVSLDGTRVYANAVGDPARPALVFVHGFSADSSIFNDIFNNPANSRDFFLVRYDTRGAGRTGKPDASESYTSDKFAQDFAAVMNAFNLQKPIIVGWSMGAMVINDVIAHLPPNTIAGGVALAGTPYFDLSIARAFDSLIAPIRVAMFGTDPVVAEQANIVFNRFILIRNPSPPADFFAETVRAFEQGSDFAEDNPAVTWETRCNLLGTATLMPLPIRRIVGTRTQDNTKLFQVAKEGFPFLAITGGCDPSCRSDVLVDAFRQTFTNMQVKTVANGSHTPFLDAPIDIMKYISEFAKRA